MIGLGFADIFRINALRNGLLTVAIERPDHQQITEALEGDPLAEVTIDLDKQQLTLAQRKRNELCG